MMKKAYHGAPLMNIANNFLNVRYTTEMCRKLVTRLRERVISPPQTDPLPWLVANRSDIGTYCRNLNSEIWDETEIASVRLEEEARIKLSEIEIDLGGAGNFPLLYFFVRHLRPDNVVETGVAAGFSSKSILSALKKNGKGRLYSSDFPYFRISEPEKYIGFVVEEDLRDGWVCLKKGDHTNLPKILEMIDKIDIFHYDSDKSYGGRQRAMQLIMPRMRKGGVVIMDDLNDNTFFQDYVRDNGIDPVVFEFHGKYVGLFFVQ